MTRLPNSQPTEETVRAFMRSRAPAIPPELEDGIRTAIRRDPSHTNRPRSWMSFAAGVAAVAVAVAFIAIVVRGTALPPDRGVAPATTAIASPTSSAAVSGLTAAPPSEAPPTSATTQSPGTPPVDESLEPVSLRNPSAEVVDILQKCGAGDPATQAKIVGMALIPSARDAPDYVALTGVEPEIQTDSPAWVIEFRGDVSIRVGIVTDPVCVVVDGEASLFATGGSKKADGEVSTPLPDPNPHTKRLPAPLRTALSPTTTPGASPRPTPPTELPLEAVVEEAGIQLRIVLDRNPMPAGQPTWLTTEVRNTGTSDLHWITDGCETHVGVSAELEGVTWHPGSATGAFPDYRDWFMESANLQGGSIWFSFAKPAHVGMVRGGCGDMAVGHQLAPGGVKLQRLLWDGTAAPRLGPPPSAPVVLTGTFNYYWRGTFSQAPEQIDTKLEISLPAWIIEGADEQRVSPVEAVDAALADPRFGPWLATRPLRSGADAFVEFDLEADVWRVGLITYRTELIRAALVDPHTGNVREVVNEPLRLSTGPEMPDLGIANGTTLTVSLVVNGKKIGTFEPGSTNESVSRSELPPMPWVVEARSPTGRLLTSMTVKEGDVWVKIHPDGREEHRGRSGRVDLSCGRLDIWAGADRPSGPFILEPGEPGDCEP